MSSLHASIVPLAKILRLNPHALYERQLALVANGLLPGRTGRGPGSGTPLSAETVAVLLISMLVQDVIKDSAEATRTLCDAPLTGYSSRKKNALGGALTFKAAMVNALKADKYAAEIAIVRVHRTRLTAQIFLAGGGQASFASGKETPEFHENFFEGMTGFYQIMGGSGGIGALAEISALLRDNEKVTNTAEVSARKNAPRKSRIKDHRK